MRTQRMKGREWTGAPQRRLFAGIPNRRWLTRSVCMGRRIRQREQQLVLDYRLQVEPATGTDHRIQSSRFLVLAAGHKGLEPCFDWPFELLEAPLADERQHSLHASAHPRPSRSIPCELDTIRNCARRARGDLEEPGHQHRFNQTGETCLSGSELLNIQKPSSARGLPHISPDSGCGLGGIIRVADRKEPTLSVSKASAGRRPGDSRRDPALIGHVANVGCHRL